MDQADLATGDLENHFLPQLIAEAAGSRIITDDAETGLLVGRVGIVAGDREMIVAELDQLLAEIFAALRILCR